MSHGNKSNKVVSQNAQVEGLKEGQSIQVNLVQEKEKKKPYVDPPEVVNYHKQPKIACVFHNLQDGKKQTDVAFNYGSGPNAPVIHLKPGKVHHYPQCVIDHVNGITVPNYDRVDNPDGKGEYAPGVVGPPTKLYMLIPQVQQSEPKPELQAAAS